MRSQLPVRLLCILMQRLVLGLSDLDAHLSKTHLIILDLIRWSFRNMLKTSKYVCSTPILSPILSVQKITLFLHLNSLTSNKVFPNVKQIRFQTKGEVFIQAGSNLKKTQVRNKPKKRKKWNKMRKLLILKHEFCYTSN